MLGVTFDICEIVQCPADMSELHVNRKVLVQCASAICNTMHCMCHCVPRVQAKLSRMHLQFAGHSPNPIQDVEPPLAEHFIAVKNIRSFVLSNS